MIVVDHKYKTPSVENVHVNKKRVTGSDFAFDWSGMWRVSYSLCRLLYFVLQNNANRKIIVDIQVLCRTSTLC